MPEATLDLTFSAGYLPQDLMQAFFTDSALVSSDSNAIRDAYLRDLTTGEVVRLTRSGDLPEPTTGSSFNYWFFKYAWSGDRVLIEEDLSGRADDVFNAYVLDIATGHSDHVAGPFVHDSGYGGYGAAFGLDGHILVSGSYGGGIAPPLREYDADENMVWTLNNARLARTFDGRWGVISVIPRDGSDVPPTTALRLIDMVTHETSDIYNAPTSTTPSVIPDTALGGLSWNGQIVIYQTGSENRYNYEPAGPYNIFAFNAQTGQTILLSHGAGGEAANGVNRFNGATLNGAYVQGLSRDGRTVIFYSTATNLDAVSLGNNLYQVTLPEGFAQPPVPNSLMAFTATTNAERLFFNPGDGSETQKVDAQDGHVVLMHRYAADGDYDAGFKAAGGVDAVTTRVGVHVRAYSRSGATVAGGDGMDLMMLSGFNDIAAGGAGDDQLFGFGGDDALDGGAGADRMLGGLGNDVYGVENVLDVVVELAGQGTDTVKTNVDGYVLGANVENLTLTGSANISGTGNDANNVIIGNGGDNTLLGGKGNDVLYGGAGNDVLNSGSGADRMYGGAGDDIYYYGAGDTIIEDAAGGTDTVYASVDYTLGYTLENVVVIGTGAVSVSGNNLDNRLEGNGAANVLQGGRGADVLLGMGGDDILVGGRDGDALTGGAGADTFRYLVATDSLTTASDTITDYEAGTDRLDLSALDADTMTTGDQAFHQVAAFTGHGGELTFSYDGGTNRTTLSLDMNGDGQADMAILFVGQVTSSAGWLL